MIYNPIFLNDEFDYSKKSFEQLQYPKSFNQSLKIKTLKINKYKCSPKYFLHQVKLAYHC